MELVPLPAADTDCDDRTQYERGIVQGRERRHSAAMFKRAIAALLWFVPTWWAYAIVAHFLGLPAEGGVVLGALVAAFVVIDPTGVLWRTRKQDVTEAKRTDLPGLTASPH